MGSAEIRDGQWSPLDGYTAGNQRRAIDPCGEVCRGECRCEDDSDGDDDGPWSVAALLMALPDLPPPAEVARAARSVRVRR